MPRAFTALPYLLKRVLVGSAGRALHGRARGSSETIRGWRHRRRRLRGVYDFNGSGPHDCVYGALGDAESNA